MKCKLLVFLQVASAAFFIAPALAQTSGTVPNHAIPIGKGAGVTGYGSAAPGTAGLPLTSNGASSDPTFQAISASALPAGVNTNVLATGAIITSAPTVDSTFCGLTAALGGATQFTFTVGAATGFSASCSMAIANLDTGRGKKMAINGVTFPNNGILWPGQSFILERIGSNWTVGLPPPRWPLQSSVQFEVNSLGSNSNDGLGTGTGAFQTIPGAIAAIANSVDANQNFVKLHLNCVGVVTYTGQVQFKAIVGQNYGADPASSLTPILSGDTTTPSNCKLTSASGETISAVGNLTAWNIEGVQLDNTGGSPCLVADDHSTVRMGVIIFAGCPGGGIAVENFSLVKAANNYSITSSAAQHVLTTLTGTFLSGGITVTCTGSPAFSNAFAYTNKMGMQYWGGTTFSGCGTATGQKGNASLGGGIDTNAGNNLLTLLPGTGTTITNPGWAN